jgi:peptidoglycan/LPS O-acetylase OafA/YrhL
VRPCATDGSDTCAPTAALQGESANLDLLRALAVLYVVAFHVALFFQVTHRTRPDVHALGHWGVLLFFVHTSFVLMASLERQSLADGAQAGSLFSRFMLRRCFRILPLSTIAVLAVVGLRLPLTHLRDGHFVGIAPVWRDVISNLLLAQNLTGAESIEAPLWSLPYEMQMYLVLPALFMLARRAPTRGVVLGAWVLCFASAYAWMRIDRTHRADMPAYVPCFLAGVAAYALAVVAARRRENPVAGPASGRGAPRRRWPAAAWPVALGLVTLAYLGHPSAAFGGLCCFAVALLLPHFEELRAGPIAQTCKLVARYSYGIYLSHFACIWLAFEKLGAAPPAIRVMTFLATATAMPVLLYHLVESPLISVGRRLTAPTKAGLIAG